MKTGQFLTTSAIVMAAFLAFPMHSLAQSDASSFGGRVPKPVCVYKGVMSDAEIEVCTGHRVHYNYAVYSGPAITVASAGGTVFREPSPSPRLRAISPGRSRQPLAATRSR